ncbi:hypothetical protein SEET0821_14393 [Salmonella enterica subsp. enterica serovar Tennessee str. TXSC_TXSC08-21]|nr:hypothetical protein SEET0821_14393 [Salmonella enterica subsp. enterica serovar Tennessee str. TXSC_TXSC08-21]
MVAQGFLLIASFLLILFGTGETVGFGPGKAHRRRSVAGRGWR